MLPFDAPPPRLVHKRPVRRIHQPDDAVVHIAGQVGAEVRGLVTAPKTSAPRALSAAPARCGRRPAAAYRPRRSRRAPRTHRRRRRSSSRPACPHRSATGSARTGRCRAQTPSRGTCRSRARRRTSRPTAECRDAGKGRAWRRCCHRFSAPAAADCPAAARSSSCLRAARQHASPDTSRRRSAPLWGRALLQCPPIHSRYPI